MSLNLLIKICRFLDCNSYHSFVLGSNKLLIVMLLSLSLKNRYQFWTIQIWLELNFLKLGIKEICQHHTRCFLAPRTLLYCLYFLFLLNSYSDYFFAILWYMDLFLMQLYICPFNCCLMFCFFCFVPWLTRAIS